MRWGVLLMAVIGAGAQELTLRAGDAARTVAVVDGRLETLAFAAGATRVAAGGPEFRLCLGPDARVVDSTAWRAEPLGEAGFRCVADGLPTVEVRYLEVLRRRVIEKHVTVVNTTAAPVLLRWIETESCRLGEPVTHSVDPRFPAYGDWGQPVLTEHLFVGIAFPAARFTAVDGALQGREYPGLELAPGARWAAHPTVLGAAADGRVERAFYDYVATLSPHWPRVPRASIYWNGFRVIRPPDRTQQGLRMVERARELKRQTGFTFDAWTYDAGFDMYRADALFEPQEPEVWPRSRDALADVGTPLGFWTSFSCIFDVPSHAWGATQGYGLQHPAAYCLAEPTYYQAIADRLSALVREFGMNSINFDGMYHGQGFGCNRPGHGHLVGDGPEAGVYGTYAVAARKMAIFERLRRERPRIILDLFICAEWASPWWLTVLDGVHTVPGDTVASELPSPWLRDALITVRDEQAFDLLRRQRRLFPLWGMDLYGNQVRADHLIDGIELTGEAMAARWEDELVMATAARGAIGNHIVCCDLHTLAESPSGLRFLGEVGNWLRANESLYRNATLLGGEPSRGEPYGYAHGDGRGRCLVGLRNPTIATTSFPLVLDETLDLGLPGPIQVTQVYPYRYAFGELPAGATLEIPLHDFAVTLLELRAADRRWPDLPVGRFTVAQGTLLVAGPDTDPPAPRSDLRLSAPDPPSLAGTVTIPDGLSAALQLSILPPAGTTTLAPRVLLDGQPVATELHFRNRGGSQDAWLLVPLPPGRHDVAVTLDCGLPTRLEAWIAGTAERAFTPTGRDAPSDLFPLAAASDGQVRRTWPALAACYALSAAPLPPGTVHLADLRERCVRAVTGWGRVGWDQSCWELDNSLRIGDRTFARGLGVHAPGRLEFVLDGAPARFRASVGVHPIPPERRHPEWPKGSVVCRVDGDGRTLWRSRRLTEHDLAVLVDLDITGVRLLSLVTEDAGDGIFDDLATWGDARLERPPAAP